MPADGGRLEIAALDGIPEVQPGDDLAALLGDAIERAGDLLPLRRDDVFVVTQKVVSKAEGRVVPEEPDGKTTWVARETRRVVARRGDLVIAETHHGFVCANAGVDIGVVITDTFGRPWRRGLVNVAIGAAGIASLVDLRGTKDSTGRMLEVTVVAVADEVAAASGLVMGKADGIPAAVVRGVRAGGTPVPASALVRSPEEDLFRTGEGASAGRAGAAT
jgi:coenzyme F420-0:L-glutamate ligase/coenzyme F420-1:gamma-L-glutamate ligase